jgi:hypothetical protein
VEAPSPVCSSPPMFIGCSCARNIEDAAHTRTPQPPHAGAVDHFVPHISTEAVNKGSRVSLFVRERRGAPMGPVVLLFRGVRPLPYPRSISSTTTTAG